MPALSVLLPTYNGQRFLHEQIDSILGQSDPDLELLVIDDGSSDATVGIVDDYARRDERVRRLASSGNRGQNRRIVALLAQARGDFVAIADQDDIWERERNARLLAAVGDCAVACGRSQLIDGEGRDLGLSILDAKGVVPGRIGPLGALFEPLVSAHAAIIRRCWVDVGAFYGVLPFDLAIGLEAAFSTGLRYVDDAVVHHRIHGGNQMNGGVLAERAQGRLLSKHRARTSLALVPAGRVALYQVLDQLARSGVLDLTSRRTFRHLADTCWNVWFGIGGRGASLERELHERLDRYAASADDLAAFSRHVRSLTRTRLSPANLGRMWRAYRGGR